MSFMEKCDVHKLYTTGNEKEYDFDEFYRRCNKELYDSEKFITDNMDEYDDEVYTTGINYKVQNMSNKRGNNWSNYALRNVVSAASHPLEYAKVLIQIGHEPIAPRSTTLFGKPALKLPNIFEYVKYIKSVDGFIGCYRGLLPKVCGNVASAFASQKVLQHMDFDKDEIDDELDEPTNRKEVFLRSVKKDLVTRTTAIIISHPFHVITIRIMAQFVGRETTYNGLFTSIYQIYQDSGIMGFFCGLVPRLLGDILSLLLASTLSYVVNTYVFDDRELQMYTSATMSFVASAIMYPFQVVSICMGVNGTQLAAGSPPNMPIYNSWLDCWSDLSRRNQLKRGSSLLMRYYVGPQVIISGRINVTLKELMDEEDIINECKLQNKSLMEFLVKPEIIEELINLTTVEPSPDVNECVRFKYSNIACEILTCDVPKLNERLAGDEALLSKLYKFVDREPPLNPLLASFFSKIMSVLIVQKNNQSWISYQFTCLQVLDFLQAKENFISILLTHMGTSAIMDLTLKLMTQVERNEEQKNNLNWLDSQQLMQSLVSLMDPTIDSERHYNVAQLLCDFIKTARENLNTATERKCSDPLLNTIESSETISLLLDHMLNEPKKESCIVGGIQVLLALLDEYKSGYEENKRRQNIIKSVSKVILTPLKDFHSLLLDPPKASNCNKKKPINTTLGVLDPPLGNTRLHVTKLFASLISTNNMDLMNEIISLGTLQVLLDLFFAFPWNNFLHTQVQSCISSALKMPITISLEKDNALYKHLILKCKLIERILDAWKHNDAQQTEQKVRQGYMGHLFNIATSIERLCSTSSFGEFLMENAPEVAESFKNFTETTLEEIQETRDIVLGGAYPNTGNEDGDECGDHPYSESDGLHQQMYTQYQIQQLSPQFIESYGFNDDDFADGDNTLQAIDHRTGMNFDLSEGMSLQSHELFKQVCAQNINTLVEDDEIFEDRDHTVIEKQNEHNDAVYSSDSEEDDSPPPDDAFMVLDIDSIVYPYMFGIGVVGWPNRDSESAVTPITIGNVWNNMEATAVEANTGWANFSSASFGNFVANFESVANDIKKMEPIIEMDLKVEDIDSNCKTDCIQESDTVVNQAVQDFAQFFKDSEKQSQKECEEIMQTCENNCISSTDDMELPKKAANIEGKDCTLETESNLKTVTKSDQEGI
ncbi:hypothetical protein FQA39_LY06574 [Lamprigera yunnana]|nr:hypothetical protein FQA39_LY06574 [Lamprigera yunnana]